MLYFFIFISFDIKHLKNIMANFVNKKSLDKIENLQTFLRIYS